MDTKLKKAEVRFSFEKLMRNPLNYKMLNKVRKIEGKMLDPDASISNLSKRKMTKSKSRKDFFKTQKKKLMKKVFVNKFQRHQGLGVDGFQTKFKLLKLKTQVERYKDGYHSQIFGNRKSIFDFMFLKREHLDKIFAELVKPMTEEALKPAEKRQLLRKFCEDNNLCISSFLKLSNPEDFPYTYQKTQKEKEEEIERSRHLTKAFLIMKVKNFMA